MNRTLIIGGVSFDATIYVNRFFSPEIKKISSKKFHETIGSAGAGKALNFQKLDFNPILHFMIAQDEYGSKVLDYLNTNGIRYLYDIDPAHTPRHINIMDDNGDRVSICVKNGTPDPEINLQLLEDEIKNHDLIVLNINNYVRHLIPLVKSQNKEIWCDIHDYDGKNEYHQDFIRAADYLFLSSDQLKDHYREFMQQQIKAGKKLVVCTHGRNGSTALTNKGQWHREAIISTYQRVDSNGAGDSFFAGFLYGFQKGLSIGRCLRYATITSGLCINCTELAHPSLSRDLLEKEYCKHYHRKAAPSIK